MRGRYLCLAALGLCLSAAAACAAPGDERAPAAQPPTDLAVINCPEEVDLQVLVDYVGKALEVRFLYGEELKGKQVQLRPSPVEVPKERLLDLLVSLLRVRDLTLVEEAPGFYRIVKSEQAARSVSALLPHDAPSAADSLRLVTQVLRVPSGKVEEVSDKLERFLTSPKSGLVPVPERDLLIVTDYESRIALLRELIDLLGSTAPVEVLTIPVPGADPETVATQVSAIISETHRVGQASGTLPAIRGDVLPGALVAIGTHEQLEQVEALVRRLQPDTVELSTRAYTPRYLSLERVEELITHVVLAPGSGLDPPAAVYSDGPGGCLYVTADEQTHASIASLLQQEDEPLPNAQRPLRIYRPKNRKAAELLATLTQLLGEGVQITQVPGSTRDVQAERGFSTPGRNRPPSKPGVVQTPPMPPAQVPRENAGTASRSLYRVQGPDYVLTEDEHTNSIIAIGTREFHAQLETLIKELDRRRPQVLIEMKLVAITLTNSQDLGVELQGLDLGDAWDYLLFSSFGLSTVDVNTGQRVLTPGVGLNGVLLDPEHVPIILHALASRGMAKVLSTPRLLVSDNARGTLRNVDEAPFTSVNASDTVATTSFAGFESAGTTLSVTPHIAEGDHLTLEYELSFSNFSGGSSSAAVPPPRTTNSFSSTVEVPDGHTVVTGGLEVHNESDSVSEVPYLGQIPLLGKLFGTNTQANSKTRIYAFIRPVILRDDEFEDLKYVTLKEAESADVLPNDPPPGEPLWMR